MIESVRHDVPIERIALELGLQDLTPERLSEAMTHPSRREEVGGSDYERLEFLGDAVLGLVVAERYYAAFPEATPEQLTSWKRARVDRHALAEVGGRLGLRNAGWIRVGAGSRTQAHFAEDSVVENVVEALVGAVYVDHGLEAARRFVEGWGTPLEISSDREKDAKSRLKELVERRWKRSVTWELVRSDPDGSQGGFLVEVRLDDRVLGTGVGRRRKIAEQEASAAALREMGAEQET